LFGAIVLMRMRALIAEGQVEARLRRRALDDDAPVTITPQMEQA
jgi:heme exporter protein C